MGMSQSTDKAERPLQNSHSQGIVGFQSRARGKPFVAQTFLNAIVYDAEQGCVILLPLCHLDDLSQDGFLGFIKGAKA